MTNSEKWKKNILKNPNKLIILPKKVGLMFPNLETKNPEQTETKNSTIINGNWISTTLIASPSKPTGKGLRIKIGNIW